MHADPLDTASEHEQELRDDAIAAISRKSAEHLLPAVGSCWNCESIVPPGVLYCDHDCEVDHAQRRAAEARRFR